MRGSTKIRFGKCPLLGSGGVAKGDVNRFVYCLRNALHFFSFLNIQQVLKNNIFNPKQFQENDLANTLQTGLQGVLMFC